VAVPFASAPGVPQLEISWADDVVRITQAGSSIRSIPLSIKIGFVDGRVEVHRLLLTSAHAEIRLPGAVQWVFGNAEAAGYYRCLHVNAQAIPAAQLSPAEQATLLEDIWDAVWNGWSDTLEYLRVARDLLERHEVSRGLLAHLRELRELLATGARGPQFDAWIVRHVGSAGGDEPLALLGFAGEANAVTRARALTNAWLDGSAADEEFLDAAVVVAARHGNEQLFDRLLAALASGALDTARLLRTIAAFESPACVEAQTAVMHHPRLAETDLLPYVEDLLANAATRVAAWSFLKENWDELGTKVISFGGRGAILSLGAFSDAGARAGIASFFRGRNVAGAERALMQTLERIDGRIRFREKEQRRFDAWLLRQSAPAIEASEPLLLAHHLLNTLAAGFHGALYQRVLFDRMGVAAPAWMHPPDDLRSAVSGLEGLWLQLFRGVIRIDAAVLQLAARLNEDLVATAQLTSAAIERLSKAADAESATIMSVLLAREVATRERTLDGRMAFASLFGNEEEANRWRALLRSSATDADRSRRWLQRVGQTGLGRTLRLELANDAASLSDIFRSQAGEVAALLPRAAQ
jgi:aminopeptidase N